MLGRRKQSGVSIGLRKDLKVIRLHMLSCPPNHCTKGLEKMLDSTAGKYCIGDEVCL